MVIIRESALHLRIFTRFRGHKLLIIMPKDVSVQEIANYKRKTWAGRTPLITNFTSLHTNNYLALNKQWNWKFKTLIVVSLRHMQISVQLSCNYTRPVASYIWHFLHIYIYGRICLMYGLPLTFINRGLQPFWAGTGFVRLARK